MAKPLQPKSQALWPDLDSAEPHRWAVEYTAVLVAITNAMFTTHVPIGTARNALEQGERIGLSGPRHFFDPT